jgi:D-3-phosphoglycerate dehydrogenase
MVGQVITHDPYASDAPAGVGRVASLEDLLARSNILTLHLPLLPETRGLIGAAQLGLLPPGAILVNVSRGGLVDEPALCAALRDGHLAGAALDVLEREPPGPGDPVLDTPGLLLTPHIAWFSTEAERRVRTQVIDGVLACLAGEPPRTGRIAVDPRIAGR